MNRIQLIDSLIDPLILNLDFVDDETAGVQPESQVPEFAFLMS
jgi:hypothetical protein